MLQQFDQEDLVVLALRPFEFRFANGHKGHQFPEKRIDAQIECLGVLYAMPKQMQFLPGTHADKQRSIRRQRPLSQELHDPKTGRVSARWTENEPSYTPRAQSPGRPSDSGRCA